ncbi:MAG: UDP-N-acetylglucosamine 1-carboxyvinyltransferase [Candidatus Kerfeldbacteria bacterium]|nr:UDP-N-acetylglucosamine 1-carboxyvinyltransferase [Candidatus Kerfeldbacteria bacterium]
MARLLIEGSTSLNGTISVSGAKNAALKMMAAALLTDKTVVLRNVPDISDIHTMQSILESLGATIDFTDHVMTISAREVRGAEPDIQLVKHLRGSVVIIGPLLARFKNVRIPQPGGCLIGSRPIDTHIRGLEQLGVSVEQKDELYTFSVKQLRGTRVVLPEMSVTATENVLMAAVCAEGTTEIRLAASEPEIEDLAVMLNAMGARIEGAGTSVITVHGVSSLLGVDHTVLPDRIEAGTLAVAAAVSRGDVTITHCNTTHLDLVLQKLAAANVSFEIKGTDTLHIKPTTMFRAVNIDTRPYPGFPTDLQAPFSVLLTQATGTSTIFETLFEGRLGYIRELCKMGASMTIRDPHTAVIQGPSPLYGKEITSLDLRAGATLVIAAIIAQGKSVIERAELIDRGYERLADRLCALGAHIKKID